MLYDKKWDKPKVKDVPARIIDRAADIIEQDGWCQCTAYDKGRHCLVGALTRAGADLGLYSGLFATDNEISQAYYRVQKTVGMPPTHWNDKAWRTKEQVIETLRWVANQE